MTALFYYMNIFIRIILLSLAKISVAYNHVNKFNIPAPSNQ
jgi:hypothetical protein